MRSFEGLISIIAHVSVVLEAKQSLTFTDETKQKMSKIQFKGISLDINSFLPTVKHTRESILRFREPKPC